MRQAVRARFHLRVRAALSAGYEILTLPEGVDCGFEQIGEVELH
jgi:hypothetical protein